MLRNKLQQSIADVVHRAFPTAKFENINLTHPAQSEYGDYSTNIAMILAKQLEKAPQDVASSLASSLQEDDYISEISSDIKVAGPGFVNFYIKNDILWREAAQFIIQPTQHQDSPGSGGKVMVEFSSPNIAKPFNVGHLRSTIIGDSLARIFNYMGYEVLRDNHLGDWGTQYGKLAYAVDNWGNWDVIEKDPIPELFKLYVKFHQLEKDDESLADAGREYFKKLEHKDPHVLKTWNKLVQLSLEDFNDLYSKLDIHFDMQLGESFYEPMLADVIEECKSSGIARESQGATLIFFDDHPELKDAPLMIQKSNGTSTYGTRDLAGIKYRINKFNLDKLIIEIGNEQQLYFKQVIQAAVMLGWIKPGQLTHVGHGLFMLPTGKMSTRKGETVWVKDLITELEQNAIEIVEKRSDISEDKQKQVAAAIAVGALKYNDLSQNRLGNVVFDKEKSLALDGNSAPYIQYTIARSKSVLRAAENIDTSKPIGMLKLAQNREKPLELIEREVLALISQFDEVVQDTSSNLLPNTLTSYLFNLGQKYNSFYQTCPIINSEDEVRVSRLCIVMLTINILTAGLDLLGIQSVERM